MSLGLNDVLRWKETDVNNESNGHISCGRLFNVLEGLVTLCEGSNSIAELPWHALRLYYNSWMCCWFFSISLPAASPRPQDSVRGGPHAEAGPPAPQTAQLPPPQKGSEDREPRLTAQRGVRGQHSHPRYTPVLGLTCDTVTRLGTRIALLSWLVMLFLQFMSLVI